MRDPRVLVLVVVCALLSSAADRPAESVLSSPARIAISGGRFVMGLDDRGLAESVELCSEGSSMACRIQDFAHEQPAHRVYVSAFAIDRTEVSRGDYGLCRAALRCPPPRVADHDARLSDPSFPVTGVTHAEASAFCAFAGGRLPTEAEWERAARAGSLRRFPWGKVYNSRVANHGQVGGTPDTHDGYAYASPVTAFIDGKSAYGLLNMAGNAWEFTADYFDANYYGQSPEVDPVGPIAGESHVLRGGSFLSPPHELRVTTRAFLASDEARPDVGFRCAYDVPGSATH